MLALLLASPSTAFRPTTIAPLDPCIGHETTAKAFQDFAAETWRPIRWERKRPRPDVVRAYRFKLSCAAGAGHRKAIKHRWRSSQRAFYEHRKFKLEQRERLRYLPFACGEGTRSAIPCSIMWCESGGEYRARNPVSSAGGKYQITDDTWWAYGGASYPGSHPAAEAPPGEQDRVAAAIYADVADLAWVCT